MKVYSNYVRNKRDGHNCRENVEVQGGVTILLFQIESELNLRKNGCICDYGFVHSFHSNFFGLANMHVLIS